MLFKKNKLIFLKYLICFRKNIYNIKIYKQNKNLMKYFIHKNNCKLQINNNLLTKIFVII